MRLDRFLVKNHYALSRSKAQILITLGLVKVNGKVVLKPSFDVKPNDEVTVSTQKYVSRGGYKLESFLMNYTFDFKNKLVLDVGCSTGGFSDFLLKKGAYVVGLDINDVLDETIRQHKNFKFIKADVTHLDKEKKKDILSLVNSKFDIVTIDVSNIDPRVFIYHLKELAKENAYLILLFKPAYVLNRKVTDNEALKLAMILIEDLKSNFEIVDYRLSEIKGGTKNKGSSEVFILLKIK